MDLRDILEDWEKEKGIYEQFTEYIEKTLRDLLVKHGIQARVVSRTKDEASIAKKLYGDGVTFQNYSAMRDKSGARVVCRFREDMERAAKYIREEFMILKEEDKSSLLKLNEIGYRSLHFDIKLREEVTSREKFLDLGNLIGEIQVRTLCEDVWAEINHDIGYKPLIEVPDDVARRIYCLGGLLEIADTCISDINNKTLESAILNEYVALKILEPLFIRLVRREYDKNLSYKTLSILLPLTDISAPQEFEQIAEDFAARNWNKIQRILNERKNYVHCFPHLTQPELLLIFYLIEKEPFRLKEIWEQFFPLQDLNRMSVWWGNPMLDI